MSDFQFLPLAVVAACIGIALTISYVAMKNFKGDRVLCTDCLFNEDELCNKAQRPMALDCVAYQPGAVPPSSLEGIAADSNLLVVKREEGDG